MTLRIFDSSGRLVRTLHDGVLPAGEQRITWDGLNAQHNRVNAGIYLCTFKAGEMSAVAKMFHYR